MKVGILTFHWGANHGAVLQAYSSMRYLQSLGYDVSIIDYCPSNQELSLSNTLRPCKPQYMLEKIKQYKKEQKIAPFRQKLCLSKRYYTVDELIDDPPDVDILITGSDQVWNSYFLMNGENKITPVYFLCFGREDCKRIALSVSFGTSSYPLEAAKIAKPFIERFDAISVREESGLAILNRMGITSGVLTADPTSLLTAHDYFRLFDEKQDDDAFIAECILRKQSKENVNKLNMVKHYYGKTKFINIRDFAIEKWLSSINNAMCVITNSFHCVMFCLKFHTPFWVLLEDGKRAGMNDRINTLLSVFSLEDRIIQNEIDIDCNKVIEWDKTDNRMEQYAQSLKSFLQTQL